MSTCVGDTNVGLRGPPTNLSHRDTAFNVHIHILCVCVYVYYIYCVYTVNILCSKYIYPLYIYRMCTELGFYQYFTRELKKIQF